MGADAGSKLAYLERSFKVFPGEGEHSRLPNPGLDCLPSKLFDGGRVPVHIEYRLGFGEVEAKRGGKPNQDIDSPDIASLYEVRSKHGFVDLGKALSLLCEERQLVGLPRPGNEGRLAEGLFGHEAAHALEPSHPPLTRRVDRGVGWRAHLQRMTRYHEQTVLLELANAEFREERDGIAIIVIECTFEQLAPHAQGVDIRVFPASASMPMAGFCSGVVNCMKLSRNIARLQPSATIAVSSLAKRLRAEGRDIIDLSAGEPDFDTPAFISEAAVEGIHAGKTRYTPTPGMPELRSAIAQTLSGIAGRSLESDGVVVSTGGKQGLFNACFCLFGPGDEVLVASPYWTSYPQIVKIAQADPVFVRGSEERDFRLTPEDLEAKLTPHTRGLILCSPSNPTGTVYSLEDLTAVAEWAKDRGIWLIADEIYRAIYFGEDRDHAPSILEIPEDKMPNYVLIDGASKSFAMTGWRLGFSFTGGALAAKMAALQSHVTSNAAAPSQVGALAAFSRTEEARVAVASMVEAFRRRRDLVVRLFSELLPEFGFVAPGGAFYLFFRVDSFFDGAITDSTTFCSWILEETGVATVPGIAFGDDRFVRMTFATSDSLLEDAIRRMARAIRER